MSENVLPLYKLTSQIENYTELNIEVLEKTYYELETIRREPGLLHRQIEEINRILSHIAFEITMRNQRDIK